jgi:pyruvate/2-oxoglutarate dehydrogenase complex dihydrolipoamide acyltransferase (E2) component
LTGYCTAADLPGGQISPRRTREGQGSSRRANIVTVLRVPKSGGIPTTKARVVRWFKKEGGKIRQGEPLVELETEKVNYELDSPVGGVVLKIVASEDVEVHDNPVVYLHHYMLTLDKGPVPDGEYVIPFGVADIKREGSDVTLVATGWMVKKSLAAAELLAEQGISVEVIDPRTLAPLDTNTIIKSVKKTGRLVLVDQATRHASAAAIIAAEVAEHGGRALKAPIKMVTALDATIPFSEPLENYVLPNEEKIVAAIKSVVVRQAVAV